MRSLFTGLAAIFFAYNGFYFIASPFAYYNPGAPGGIDGDAGAVAVTWAARTLFVGLALLSAALIDWKAVARAVRALGPSNTGDDA